MIRRLILFSRVRSVFILAGLFVVSTGVLLVTAVLANQGARRRTNLNQYWRTTYDILVRPAGTRSPIEEKYGLVGANQLSGIWGGITFDQYEAIKSIPGVEGVAAPIAMMVTYPEERPLGNPASDRSGAVVRGNCRCK